MPAHEVSAQARGRHISTAETAPGRRLLLVLLSALAPGSGHLLAGWRRTGLVILACFAVVTALAVAVALTGYLSPESVASRAVQTPWLVTLRWGMLLVGSAWVGVILHSALLPSARRPRGGAPVARWQRSAGDLLPLALAVVLAAGIAVPIARVSQYANTTAGVIDEVFDSYEPSEDVPPGPQQEEAFFDGRVNVLLIGADADRRDDSRSGLRTDTIIVASVDPESGRTLLFTLPRNMQRMPFPADSPMAKQYPSGFGGCGAECMLNAIHTHATALAQSNPELFPGDPQPGITALRGAVGEALGLSLDYYVLVDLEGFEKLIDALGGVTIRVDTRLPINGLSASGRPIRPSGYIEPGLQVLSGYNALWYARSRSGPGESDYTRGARQRCLLGAVLREVDPRSLILDYQEVVSSAPDALETDIPREVLPELVKVLFRARQQAVESLAFVPPLVPDTADPDYDAIRALVQQAITRADSEPAPTVTASPGPSAEPGQTPNPAASPSTGQPVDLASVCSYT